MTAYDTRTRTTFRVVVNREQQRSIWPTDRELPIGWSEDGPTGPRAECLAYIEQTWTDMRPRSLRDAMARAGDDDGTDGARAS